MAIYKSEQTRKKVEENTLSLVFFLQNKQKLQFPDIKVLTQQAKGAGVYCSGESSGNDKLIKKIK